MSSTFNPQAQTAALQRLTDFFKQQVPSAGTLTIGEDTALLGSGLLDSLTVIQLMVFLGSEFGIDIEDDDFTPENLNDVGSLLRFIARKQAASS